MSALLAKIQRYVKQHGFKTEINHADNYVAIYIPVACDGEDIGDEIIKVRTFEETRAALGY